MNKDEMGLNPIAIEQLFQSYIETVPNLQWVGVREGKIIKNPVAKAGVDIARGLWIKFDFQEADLHNPSQFVPRSVQGYLQWNGAERVKLDGNIEVDGDKVSEHFSFPMLAVNFSGIRKVNNVAYPFIYSFSALIGQPTSAAKS